MNFSEHFLHMELLNSFGNEFFFTILGDLLGFSLNFWYIAILFFFFYFLINSQCKIGNLSSKMFFDWRIKHFDFIYVYFYAKHVYSLTLYELPEVVDIINYTTNQNNNNNNNNIIIIMVGKIRSTHLLIS